MAYSFALIGLNQKNLSYYDIVSGRKIDISRNTIEVDSGMIDLAVDELSKLILRLDKNPRNPGRNRTRLRKFKRFGIRYKIQYFMRN